MEKAIELVEEIKKTYAIRKLQQVYARSNGKMSAYQVWDIVNDIIEEIEKE